MFYHLLTSFVTGLIDDEILGIVVASILTSSIAHANYNPIAVLFFAAGISPIFNYGGIYCYRRVLHSTILTKPIPVVERVAASFRIVMFHG